MARANLEARLAALELAQHARMKTIYAAYFRRVKAVLGDDYDAFLRMWFDGEELDQAMWDRLMADPEARGRYILMNWMDRSNEVAVLLAGRDPKTI